MGFNQNQDTLKTLRLTIFLIIIEVLFIFASAISVIAMGNDVPDSIFFEKRDELLKIEDFKFHPAGFVWHYTGLVLMPEFVIAYYEDDKGHVFKVDNKVDLQKRIDAYNDVIRNKQSNPLDMIGLLVASISFAVIPYPFNIIPLLITVIIGFIIAYLVFSEIKGWFGEIWPG